MTLDQATVIDVARKDRKAAAGIGDDVWDLCYSIE